MPKKKKLPADMSPMTQDQMLRMQYQYDMVPSSQASGPMPGRTEAQRLGKAKSALQRADEDLYQAARNPASTNKDMQDLSDASNSAYEDLETERKRSGYSRGGKVMKKATGGPVRGFGIAVKGRGKGKMC